MWSSQRRNESNRTGRSCNWSKEREVAWKIDIKSCFVYIVFELLNLKFSFVLPSLFKIEGQKISLVSLLAYLYAYALLVVSLFLFYKEAERFLQSVMNHFNPLSTKPTKWSNTLKQIVGKLPTNCLSVFDHFVKFAFKGLSRSYLLSNWLYN